MSVTLPAPEFPPGPRSALVIATSSYADARLSALRAPALDAVGLAQVLGDPEIGGFGLTELLNKGVQELRVSVEEFLSGRDPEETVAVYVSCHGVLTARRRLYFAAGDTDKDRLAATGLDARWLNECLDECRARRQVVILDCCFSGAFALAKGSEDVGLEERFAETAPQGRGRVVLTASRATEYSFESGTSDPADTRASVFTAALLDGLRTGEADRDRDGFISASDAYAYAYARIKNSGQAQTPQFWVFGGEGGEVILARSPRGIVVEPAALPDDLQASLENRYPQIRVAAVGALAEWLGSADPGRAMTARAVLEKVAAEDIPSVAQAARSHLASNPVPATTDTVRPAVTTKPAPPARQPRARLAGAARGGSEETGPVIDKHQVPLPGPVSGQRDTTPRRVLGGRYELDGIVGPGGRAEVFRARDTLTDRIVGVKTLHENLARDQNFQARFRREAQIAASLNDPSIVAVYDTGEDMVGGTPVPYIVMEFVDGRTLRDLLRDDRRLLPERAAEITDGVLRALDYIHRNGIVHRDIKPTHVMLTRNGDVKVLGFGIADAQATMTKTAYVVGTAQYLSPEQARGERVDARSDLYSAGCLLYELLTGRPPFTGDSPVAIAYQHVREEPVPPSRIDAEIPPWADAIVLKAMAKDAGDRYQSAAEMRSDIQRALRGDLVRADPRDPGTDQSGRHGTPPFRSGSSDRQARSAERKPPWRFRKS